MAESQKKTRVVLSCPKLNMSKVFLSISMYFLASLFANIIPLFPCNSVRPYWPKSSCPG